MRYFPLPHRASLAFGLADRQGACCCAALSRGTWGHRPLNLFLNHRLPTRGASHVGDAMTSGQQSPHGGCPNGG